jgi:Ala-tRNA(Pro) deacylase
MRVDDFLTDHHVPFQRHQHEPVFTANRVAEALHIPGKEMAKTVLVRTNFGYILAVLPATHRIDLEQLRLNLGEHDIELASEAEMNQLFPDCETGAIPPFGSLYDLTTVVDETLSEDKEIVFEAQNHAEAISMTYEDFARLEHPRMGHFARQLA